MECFPEETIPEEVVQFRPGAGQVRYLIEVRCEACGRCPAGVRTRSVWVTAKGRGEAIAWCGHCFNATCERVPLGEDQHRRLRAVLAAASAGRVSALWKAVRPALEDLERRGVLRRWLSAG